MYVSSRTPELAEESWNINQVDSSKTCFLFALQTVEIQDQKAEIQDVATPSYDV